MASVSTRIVVRVGNPRVQSEEFAIQACTTPADRDDTEFDGVYAGEDDFGVEGKVEAASAEIQEAKSVELGEHPVLVINYIPEYLMSSEFLDFLSPSLASVAFIRVFRHEDMPSRFGALLQFRNGDAAEGVLKSYHGRLFNSFAGDRCNIGVVEQIEASDANGETSEAPLRALPHPRLIADKDPPSCAVCLEPIDLSGGVGVLSTLCNHIFHTGCYLGCSGGPCPVCRYYPGDSAMSSCQECSVIHDVWVCLICGHAGCGRYSNEHARAHFLETLHAYALETHTQQVWDFAGDGYVHRLLYEKSSDKLVEGMDPSSELELGRPQEPSEALVDAQEEEAMHSKLEWLAQQHNYLLTAELRRQREYFESRLQEIRRKGKAKGVTKPSDVLASLRKQRRRLEARAAVQEDRIQTLEEECRFLMDLNSNLRQNDEEWKEQYERTRKELEALEQADEAIPVLEEQVGDLMRRLDEYSNRSEESEPDENTFKDFLGDIVKVLEVLQQTTDVLTKKMPE